METVQNKNSNNDVNFAILKTDVEYIKKSVDGLTRKLDDSAVESQKIIVSMGEVNSWKHDFDIRLTKLEGWQTWLLRLVVGAVVLAVIGVAYQLG